MGRDYDGGVGGNEAIFLLVYIVCGAYSGDTGGWVVRMVGGGSEMFCARGGGDVNYRTIYQLGPGRLRIGNTTNNELAHKDSPTADHKSRAR